MLYVENDRDPIAAVSRALGESRSLVRNRGFQLIEIVVFNGDDSQPATYNRGPFDIATLAIFPEYLEFEGQEVLQLVVEGAAGRTAT